MATSFQVFFIISSFTVLVSLPFLSIATTTTNPKFAIDLIHRGSPFSPLFNPQTTFQDRLEKSFARYEYLASKRRDIHRAAVIPDDSSFIAKLSIGTPPVDVFMIIDSSSDLLWVQCNPCIRCLPETKLPVYDRTKSVTFGNVKCNSVYCGQAGTTYCDNGLCSYKIQYADESFSEGILGYEFIWFTDSNNGTRTTPMRDFVIGCGVNNSFSMAGQAGGILGLATDGLSLVDQLTPSNTKPRFSYCLGNASDPSSRGNLIIGKDARIAGFTTPFTFSDENYVQVLDIKVGSQSLGLPPSSFGSSNGSVLIDSGTKFSFFPAKVVDLLAEVIRPIVVNKFKIQQIILNDQTRGIRCFRGNIGKDLNGFPTVTIIFQGHATLVLEEWSIFLQDTESRFCLAFAYSHGDGHISIIGNRAQQFYNIGFDFVEGKLSINHSDCSH